MADGTDRQTIGNLKPFFMSHHTTATDYIAINRELWNSRTAVHLTSEFYDQQSFIKGRTTLKEIELDLLGDISGKKVLHLQCHFGQDSISMARMGAQVTGVDLSDKAVDAANDLARQLNADARFICCDLYDLPNHLDDQFDLVFTSYGTIGWLPDINKWAAVVARFLKPGGKFVFVEFHPVVWMFDNDFKEVAYRYFNSDPIIEMEEGTYADTKADINQQSIGWNHGMAEVMTSLLHAGLHLFSVNEYDYSPYNCLNHMIEVAADKYRIKKFGDKIPLVYSITCHKP